MIADKKRKFLEDLEVLLYKHKIQDIGNKKDTI